MVEPTNNEQSAFEEPAAQQEPAAADVVMEDADAQKEEEKPVGQSISGMVNQQFAA